MMRAAWTWIFASLLLVACNQKSRPLENPHDPGQTTPQENEVAPFAESDPLSIKPDELESLRDELKNIDDQNLPAFLERLEERLFSTELKKRQLASKTHDYLSAVAVYQKALARYLNLDLSASEKREATENFMARLFEGCPTDRVITSGSCASFALFPRDASTIDLLIFSAQNARTLDRRYLALMTAFEFSTRVQNVKLIKEYVITSYDFAECLKSGKCPVKNSEAVYQRHIEFLKHLAAEFPETAEVTPDLADAFRSMKLLSRDPKSPLAPAQVVLLERFGSYVLYKDRGLSPEFSASISEQNADAKSLARKIADWKKPGTDSVSQASGVAFRQLIDFEPEDLLSSEYFYLIEGMYLNRFDSDMAEILWNNTRKDLREYMTVLKKYYDLRMLETLLKSNVSLKAVFDEMRAKRVSYGVVVGINTESRRMDNEVWKPFLDQRMRARSFYQIVSPSVPPGETKTELAKQQKELERYFDSFDANVNSLVLAPNMWIIGHLLQEFDYAFDYVAEYEGTQTNKSRLGSNLFFRDMLESGVETWFGFAKSGDPYVSRQDAILGLNNVFATGLYKLYGIEPKELLEKIARYYLLDSKQTVEKSLNSIRDFTTGNRELNIYMGACYREAVRVCSDIPDSISSDAPDGGLRICKHRASLEPFKRFAALKNVINLDWMERSPFAGIPAEWSKGAATNRWLLQRGTSFYNLPYLENPKNRNLGEFLEILITDSNLKLSYLESIAKTLRERFSDQADIVAGLDEVDAQVSGFRTLVQRSLAQVLTWEDRVGDCYLALARGERERVYKITSAEGDYLRQVHRAMKSLRELKAQNPSLEDFKNKTAELNASLRRDEVYPNSDIVNLRSAYPLDKFGFNDEAFNYNGFLFALRAIRYMSVGTPNEPSTPIDPGTEYDFARETDKIAFPWALKITGLPWTDSEDEFVSMGLELLPKNEFVASWYILKQPYQDMTRDRLRYLSRLPKLGRIVIEKSAWTLEGGVKPYMFNECSAGADKVCLELNMDNLVDAFRASTQHFLLDELDLRTIALVKTPGRIRHFGTMMDGFYCYRIKNPNSIAIDHCDKFYTHFDVPLKKIMESTTMDDPESMGATGVPSGDSSAVVIFRRDFLDIAQEFAEQCRVSRSIFFNGKMDILGATNALMQERVNNEFGGRDAFIDSVRERRKRDLANGNILTIKWNVYDPVDPEPLYISRALLDDARGQQSLFDRKTSNYYKEARKCLPQ